MKKPLSLFILAVILSGTVYAQKMLDPCVQYRITYTFFYQRDSTRQQYDKDLYFLDICKEQSFFYSRTKFYRDSVKKAIFAKMADVGATLNAIRPLKRGLNWYNIKEFANQRISLLLDSPLLVFRTDEALAVPNWRLSEDTLTVSGYVCKKATAFFKGRKWTAWYAPDIPLSDGPWLLWGLPGIILRANDSKGYFSFEGMEITEGPYTQLVLPHEKNRTKQVNMKEYKQLEASDLSNDHTLIRKMSGVIHMEAYNADGTPSHPIRKKFIPLIK